MRALGIYREPEFSPGKVAADAAILDGVLDELRHNGFEVSAVNPASIGKHGSPQIDLVLAMCQGAGALAALSAIERTGAVAINPALAIRNCYRDLLGAGLARAGVPIPLGVLIDTALPLDESAFARMPLSVPVYLKRGDLHALGPDDVKRVDSFDELRMGLATFNRRGIARAYVQQAVEGPVVKFYGVSGGEFFAALPDDDELPETLHSELANAASIAASAIGLEAWGGDAVIDSAGGFKIIDFNDWPSYSRVRDDAARAIARRATWLLQRARHNIARAGSP